MTRNEFAKPYLVALYKEHRANRARRPSIRELISEYELPRDEYLEGELYEYLSLHQWAADPQLSTEMNDGMLLISGPGKIMAESYVQDGIDPVRRDAIETKPSYSAPASDRLVSLSHNQFSVVLPPADELVDALEIDNGNPEQPGLREQLLGEIKAGRELLRAGTFRSFLLYETLVRALGELIKRYTNPTIVALANALLGAVVSEILQAK